MELQPMNERILVRRIELDDRRETKILMPAALKSGQAYCEIIAMGPGALTSAGERITPTLIVGDVVMMLPTHGTKIRINGEDLKLTSEREILCKVIG